MAKYLVQDSLYLKQYAKVLALIAAKSTDSACFLTMSAAAHKVRDFLLLICSTTPYIEEG
jgi:thiaminase